MKLKKTVSIFGFSIGLIYLLTLSVFLIWMLFFDENSYTRHRQYNKEIQELETAINYYKKKIEADKLTIKQLQDTLSLKRYAREKYLMKKENETIYLIDFDTVQK